MKANFKLRLQWMFVAMLAACHYAAPVASACSVCFGDKDDPMVKGTANGVLVMIGVTYGMLLAMGGLAATWFVRARRIRMSSIGSTSPVSK